MKHDWDRNPVKKAWGVKETIERHQLCGGYIHYRGLLEAKLSGEEFGSHRENLHKGFLQGFMDADIEHALKTTVPPSDVTMIGIMRTDRSSQPLADRASLFFQTNVFLSILRHLISTNPLLKTETVHC